MNLYFTDYFKVKEHDLLKYGAFNISLISYQTLSEVKDTYLTGKIKKSKAALVNTVIKTKAIEHNINLGIK